MSSCWNKVYLKILQNTLDNISTMKAVRNTGTNHNGCQTLQASLLLVMPGISSDIEKSLFQNSNTCGLKDSHSKSHFSCRYYGEINYLQMIYGKGMDIYRYQDLGAAKIHRKRPLIIL